MYCIALYRRVMYDRSTLLWQLLFKVLTRLKAAESQGGGGGGGKGKARDLKGGLFWAAHQRFYRQMLMAAKVRC